MTADRTGRAKYQLCAKMQLEKCILGGDALAVLDIYYSAHHNAILRYNISQCNILQNNITVRYIPVQSYNGVYFSAIGEMHLGVAQY